MIEFLVSLFLGYEVAKKSSHPSSKIYRKLPVVKIKFIQLLPNLKIYVRGKIVHLHHWIYMSFLLVFSFYNNNGFFTSPIFKGLLTGSILQGFTFPDWKRIIFNSNEKKLLKRNTGVAERI